MTDTLMTPADSTTDAGASGAAPAAAPAAPAAVAQPAAAEAAKPVEGQEAAKPAGQGDGTVDAGDAGKPDAKAPEPAKADDAPLAAIEYTPFTMPAEVKMPDTLVASLTDYAKGLRLPQDQAQALIDLGAKQYVEQSAANEARVDAVRQSWISEAQADPEFGGDKLATSLPIAQKALTTFGSEKLTELLRGTGLGNHPEVIRFMLKVGQAIGEDGVVTGAGGSGTGPKDTAKKLYPGMA